MQKETIIPEMYRKNYEKGPAGNRNILLDTKERLVDKSKFKHNITKELYDELKL